MRVSTLKILSTLPSSSCHSFLYQLLKPYEIPSSLQRAVFLFPSRSSLPSPKTHAGSLCLPVTLYSWYSFLLYLINDAIFNLFIKNRITLDDVREGRGDETEISSLHDAVLESELHHLLETDGFLLFSHSTKTGASHKLAVFLQHIPF
jgi:hypothetical protein